MPKINRLILVRSIWEGACLDVFSNVPQRSSSEKDHPKEMVARTSTGQLAQFSYHFNRIYQLWWTALRVLVTPTNTRLRTSTPTE
ncbi:hypothetical protein Q1695_010883 [Nippostrongylus brasiliensis]|nr:hypothetical protein Q1695_010883 [Nippostrongylus brasiliensis]